MRTTKSGDHIYLRKKQKDVDTLSYKTVSANKNTARKEWVVVDATDQILGRLAARVAIMLRGKHKANFTPHVDCGDNVIIINAEKVKLTGLKAQQREYIRHSGYPGGQKSETVENLLKRRPIAVVERSVKGMLPKNRLGSELFRNLHVFEGENHPHEAQQPKKIDLNTIK